MSYSGNNFCIIEKSFNTSYIESLLTALFSNDCFDNLLTNIPEDIKFSYLQDIIYEKFIKKIRKFNSIDQSVTNEIRNYSTILGWHPDVNFSNPFKVSDYYKFLIEGLGTCHFKYQECCNNDKYEIRSLPYIDLTQYITENKSYSIKTLFEKWIDSHFLRKINNGDLNLQYTLLDDEPFLLTFNIDRTESMRYAEIDIMQKIKIDENVFDQNYNLSWKINSIICYSFTKQNYYSIVNKDDKCWFLFDSLIKPSIMKYNKLEKDSPICEQIKKECVFIVYKLENIMVLY